MEPITSTSRYPACDSIKRQPIDTYVDPEVAKAFGEDYIEPLPLYELKLFQYLRKRYYSMANNELLRCRWKHFREEYFTRAKTPYQAPKESDVHFYHGLAQLRPSESIGGPGSDYRKKLTFCYKVDKKGITPVPCEAHSRQTTKKKNEGHSTHSTKQKNLAHSRHTTKQKKY